ncbi:MAG TPA: hypothetical protein VGG61_03040 [Gemmataceae bacterium]
MSGKTLLVVALVLVALGCGGSGSTVPNPTGKGGLARMIDRSKIREQLRQIGLAYQLSGDNPPKGPDDLLPNLENNQTFAKLLKDGDVVVIWGVRQSSLPSTSQTILAYEKNADEKGERYVLMADCSSVKAMNEQEFKSAPKAGK